MGIKLRGLTSEHPANARGADVPRRSPRPSSAAPTPAKSPRRVKPRNPWNERASFVLYVEEQIARTKPGGPKRVVTRIVCHHLESGRQRSWRLTNLDRLPVWIAHMLKTDRANRPDLH